MKPRKTITLGLAGLLAARQTARMQKGLLRVALSVALTLAATFVACDKSPARPTPVGGGSDPASRSLVLIEITEPATVAPGTTAQYTAVGKDSQGATRDLTGEVTWRSSDAVLSMSARGLATGRSVGEVTIAVQPLLEQRCGLLLLEGASFRADPAKGAPMTAAARTLSRARLEAIDGPKVGTSEPFNETSGLYVVSKPARRLRPGSRATDNIDNTAAA